MARAHNWPSGAERVAGGGRSAGVCWPDHEEETPHDAHASFGRRRGRPGPSAPRRRRRRRHPRSSRSSRRAGGRGTRSTRCGCSCAGRNLVGAEVTSAAAGLTTGPVKVNDAGTYLFVDVTIDPKAAPGPRAIGIRTAAGAATIPLEILAPLPRPGRFQGFSPDDAIYLLMPDRFANGDPGERRPGRVEGPPRSDEGPLLPRRRPARGDRSPAVPEGPRGHRDLAQPLVRQRQPPERARDLRRPGDHRLPRLRRGGLLRGRGAARRPRHAAGDGGPGARRSASR